ncbi:MAG: ribonuclease HI family protein [Proteobacteria bacterium]|nr:ribonuclease HI family protein [Pseudomonadota bacterium]
MKLIIFTDGGARGNPGPSATGIVIKNEKRETIKAYGEYLGNQTNNYAEYSAIISALTTAKELKADEVECFLDSKLVVEQLYQKWRVKEPTLQKLFIQAYNASAQFKKVSFKHIYREKNKEADKLVNDTLDKR